MPRSTVNAQGLAFGRRRRFHNETATQEMGVRERALAVNADTLVHSADRREGLPSPKSRFWLGDFEFRRDGVLIKKTGWLAPYSLCNLASFGTWLRFFFAVHMMKPADGPRFAVHFAPDRVRPWYLIWAVMKAAGGRAALDPRDADVIMHFEDATYGDAAPPPPNTQARHLNFGCRDVSKSRVARASEAAFGTSLVIDPRAHHGPAVEKCELNGAHDGRIVTCPVAPRAGQVYQRVIDNRADNPDLVEDFRTPTVGGKPVCVFIKRRRIGARFANANTEVELKTAEQCFSAQEITQISDFCARMNLEWGGLDILRDRGDGRLYVVDANKTDMGPPIALPLEEKLIALRALAQAFRAYALED